MSKMIKVIFLASLLVFQGCFVYGEKKMLSLTTTIKKKEDLGTTLTSVNVSNNKVTINGSGLGKATIIKLTGNNVDADLNISSISDSQIIATAKNALSLMVGGTFNLIIGTVDAQATYPITFTLQNGAVDSVNLASMSATAGQVLKFNGAKWLPTSQIDVQTYIGTWDATTIIPDVTLSNQGDYYIVSVAGAGYAVGDWIISDGYNWTKVAYSKTSVASFNGRKGIVTLQPSDYVSLKDATSLKITGSALKDIADIDITTTPITDGQVLKWNVATSKWLPGNASSSAGIALTDLSASAPLSYDSGTGVFSLPDTNILGLPLTNLTSATGGITAADSILGAFGKLMNTQSDYVSKSSATTLSSNLTFTGSGSINLSGLTSTITIPTANIVGSTNVTNVEYVTNAIANNGVWAKGASSSINYTAGNVGIGTAAPTAKLDINGNTNMSGSLTVPAWMGSNALPSLIIGTDPAYGLLRVNGNASVAVISAGNIAAQFTTLGVQAAGYGIQNSTNPRAGGLAMTTGSIAWGPSTTMDSNISRIGAGVLAVGNGVDGNSTGTLIAGNIGIGTTAPTNLLSLGGNTARTVWMERHTTADTAGNNLTLQAGGATSAATDKSGGGLILSGGTATGTGSSNISFQTASAQGSTNTTDNAPTTKMTILGSGKVGIGTAAPESSLHIQGNSAGGVGADLVLANNGDTTNTAVAIDFGLDPSSSANGAGNAQIKAILTGTGGTGQRGADLTFSTWTNTAFNEVMRLTKGGIVGIGTTAPTSKIHSYESNASTSNSNGVTIEQAGTGDALLHFLLTGVQRWTMGIDNSDADKFKLGTNADLGSNNLLTVDTAGNVGVGTTAPGANLDVVSTIRVSGGTTPFYISDGTAGCYNGSFRIGTTQCSGTVATDAIIYASSSGNVGIGTTAPGAALDVTAAGTSSAIIVPRATTANRPTVLVNGMARYNSTTNLFEFYQNGAWVNYTTVSDGRLKTNIVPVNQGLNIVNQLNPVFFDWDQSNPRAQSFGTKHQVGFIAQEVEKVLPEVVNKGEDTYRSVEYGKIVAIVVAAVQELYHRFMGHDNQLQGINRAVASMKAENKVEVDKLKEENKALKARLEKIEKILEKSK